MLDFERQADGELDWLAWQYISGDLDPCQTASFESELETSQAAREAVARAVELTQAVACAEASGADILVAPAAQSGSLWSRRLSWMATGATAGVVAASVAGLVWMNMGAPTISTTLNRTDPRLAESWVEAREEVPAEASDMAPATDEPVDTPSEDADESPSWMRAGVISLSGGTVEEDADADGKPDESWDDEVWEN